MQIDKPNFLLAAILEICPGRILDLDVLNNLFVAGLDLVYLRADSVAEVNWKSLIAKLNPAFKNRIIIPASASEFVPESALIGHWKEAERKELLPEMLRADKVYSTSVHHLPDILDLPACFRYVFYSPVFPSISKPGYQPQIDLVTLQQNLKTLRNKKTDLPYIIALGGMQADNVKQVKNFGFDAAAFMGALWQSADPGQAYKEIKEALIS